ncbi:hypothetical protein Syun_006795 [Stephania yunnanensis]|uniref:Uncharacterized protein n=1 Tax=Stephania yunnanensis TaxID=152371 RepID=A0AAP0L0P0_9MAGN
MGAAMRLGRMRNGDERSPIDSGCGPTRIAAAAKAGLLLCRGDVVLCDRGEKRAPFGVPPVLRALGVGLWAPHSAVLKHGPRTGRREETTVEAASDLDVQIVRRLGYRGERLIEPSSRLVPSEVSLGIGGVRVRVLSGKAND